ncbi:alpha-N-acetyl-neuraminyl-2,3-beta-galactosyl-1,3-N-acetyl-galactosaminide alpha-2,6-sialyltransferase isoform X1 [Nerophis lumbriciformis]|uniref:alpha-N-acetyl-neuraminyl-2,3-beta-galactosyl-1, 3-N-acetyl-galactosaminide alpha-2,6-sialyltransferase isoform X1 n=1 Tax=Nerophis lumbriciformis TaxID=546530 RepID=UPI002ADF18C6|nr:alpha-N-acetylgalactosaminide alpha-2,6-sialyltransferase 3-like isoform X1 [Nerophis lumbriciformis]
MYPRTQTLRWLCLLSISLPVLFWFGHVITREGSARVAKQSVGLRGYVRVSPDTAEQFLNVHFNQCALVSSSGQMLGAGLGADIDKIQCVIRMNNAPTLGYEKDVGSRTSVRVVSHTSAPHLVKNQRYYFEEAANTTYVFWGPQRNMRTDGKGGVFNALLRIAKKYPDVRMYAMTQERVAHCDQIFQNETGKNRLKSGAYLSTGFFTMILAMEMCDSIRVYGMINTDFCSGTNHSAASYHYYERGKMNECRMYRMHERTQHGGHRFITEKAIYAKWASRHKMEFKHPSWNISNLKLP